MFDRIFEGSVPTGRPFLFQINLRNFRVDALGPDMRHIGSRSPDVMEVECTLPLSNGARHRGSSVGISIMLCRECGMISSYMEGAIIRCQRCGNDIRTDHPDRVRGRPRRVRADDVGRAHIEPRFINEPFTDSTVNSKSEEEKEREKMEQEFEENFEEQWEKLSEFENLPNEIKKFIRDKSKLFHCSVTEDILQQVPPDEYDNIQQNEVIDMIQNQMSETLAIKMEKDYEQGKGKYRYTSEYIILLPKEIIKLLIKTFWAGFDYHKNQINEDNG